MDTRQKILKQIVEAPTPAWQHSVYAKSLFRVASKVAKYFGVLQLITFCDALSILFVSYVKKFTSYFDLNESFDR